MRRSYVGMLVFVAAVNAYVAFWDGFRVWNLVAAIVLTATAVYWASAARP